METSTQNGRSDEDHRERDPDDELRREPLQPSVGVREDQPAEERPAELEEAEAEPVEDRLVRLGEDAREPGEPGEHHDRAGARLGAVRPDDEPGGDEDERDRDLQGRTARHRRGVVGRDDERERHRRDQDRKCPQSDGEAARHFMSLCRAAPDNSAFGMNPSAPHSLTIVPKSAASRLETSTMSGDPFPWSRAATSKPF